MSPTTAPPSDSGAPVSLRRSRSRRRSVVLLTVGALAVVAPWRSTAPAVAAPPPATPVASTVPTSSTSSSTTSPTSTTTGPSTSTTRPSTTATTATTATAAAVLAPVASPATATKPARRLHQIGSLPFPMAAEPRCDILDSFGQARSGGRSHEGVDILATEGQQVYAVADGVLKRQYVVGGPSSSLSGNAWQLNEPDGTYYFYAHLSRFADGLTVGSTVRRGDVIGYVGDTGNPGAGNFHLHFEVHPKGGAAVDAIPLLEIPAGCTLN